jgi:competence protein ComEC
MNRCLKSPVLYLILTLALGLRYWQAEESFQSQREIFGKGQKGIFQVWVSEDPEVLFQHLPGSHDTGRSEGFYQPFVREVRAVCTLLRVNGLPVQPVKIRCTLKLSTDASHPVLSYGDLLQIDGKIQPPSIAMNPGQFDYAEYLKTKGVAYVSYAAPGTWRKIILDSISPGADEKSWFFLRWAYGLKRWAEDSLYRYLPFPENALLDGILLGERSPLPDEMVRSFFLTGTIHILAVSGMITAFIAGLFFVVFRAFQLNRRWAAGLTLIALLFFVFITGAHPPVCRAGLFSALALLALLFERRINGGALLMGTAVFLILLNPFVLEDLSFQISFLATAGLMVMAPWIMEKLSFLWRPAALLITATTSAQLAVWCLVIYDFNQLSVYSILSNLLIVPLALFATAGGLTLLAGASIHPALGTLFGAACEAPLKLLILLTDGLAKLPHSEWIIASPPLAWVLLFHALVLISFFWFWPSPRPEKPSDLWKKKREVVLKGRRWVLWAWALFLLATGAALAFSALSPQPLRIVFLAVGHGNAVVLRSPQGRVLVADGGNETHGPDRYSLVVSYLRHIGVERVEAVLNTHPDEDHVGGLVNVLSAYPVGEAYEGNRAQSNSAIYGEFKQAIVDRGVKYLTLKEGNQLGDLEPAQVEILHPPDDYQPQFHADNNLSLVSMVSFGGVHVMLPGDLEKDGLLKLLKDNRPFPKVDWLMAPHHGRRSGEPLLCAQGFKPRFIVLSDWRDYPDDHELFKSVVPSAVVLSTAEEGAIEVEIMPDGHGRYRSFRQGKWVTF